MASVPRAAAACVGAASPIKPLAACAEATTFLDEFNVIDDESGVAAIKGSGASNLAADVQKLREENHILQQQCRQCHAMMRFLEERHLLAEFLMESSGSVVHRNKGSPEQAAAEDIQARNDKQAQSATTTPPADDDSEDLHFESELIKIKAASHGVRRVFAKMGDSAPPSDAQRRYVFQLGRAEGMTTQDVDALLATCGAAKGQISKLIDFMIRRQQRVAKQ